MHPLEGAHKKERTSGRTTNEGWTSCESILRLNQLRMIAEIHENTCDEARPIESASKSVLNVEMRDQAIVRQLLNRCCHHYPWQI